MNEQRDETLECFIDKSKQLEAQRKIDKQQWEACASYETPRNLVHLLFRGKGRINRVTFCLLMIAIATFMFVMYKWCFTGFTEGGAQLFFWSHMWIIWAICTKRFHDLNTTGTWKVILGSVIPFYGIYCLIKLGLCQGDSEANIYGHPPTNHKGEL